MSVRHATRWTRLFDEHRAGLRGFFRRRRVHREDTDDLVQEVYARLLRSTGTDWEDIADPEAYLYTVAANLNREHAVWRQRNDARMEDIGGFEELLSDGQHPETLLEGEQRRDQVRMILDGLPEKTRDVLILQYRDGLTYQQIADTLGLSVHAVKKHVSRGLDRCRQAAARNGCR